ncbi:dockerin type I domain-containing protein [Stieleria sp. JC731]|uniref:dockerin type I domain-containing protein n=1 Tax=Pirellulaceae TaxID=2691357 RepID=UPI001E417F3A|nr:dockerin type I domain-containing protein [Stieleria sp. JC731]MCC9601162.1 dockerin type I domain-containing protein [Stieleria sp. JC731]
MKSRTPRCENLEARQLLAGDICELPTEITVLDGSFSAGLIAGTSAEGESVNTAASLHTGANPDSSRDWVEESDGQLVAIRLNPSLNYRPAPGSPAPGVDGPVATAYLFQRDANDQLNASGTIELNFLPEQVIWTEHQLVIVGSNLLRSTGVPTAPTTYIATADRTQLSARNQTSIEGSFWATDISSDRLFVTTFDADSPQPSYAVTVLDTSAESLTKIASIETAGPVAAITSDGQSFLITEPTASFFDGLASRLLKRYVVGDNQINAIDEVTIPANATSQIAFSDNGQSITAVTRTVSSGNTATASLVVTMIEIGDEGLSVFESFNVGVSTNQSQTLISDTSVVSVTGNNEVAIINADPSIDTDSSNRIRRVSTLTAIPQQWVASSRLAQLNDDVFIFARRRSQEIPASGIAPTNAANLSLLSISENRIVSDFEAVADDAAIFFEGQATPTLVQWTDYATEIRQHELAVLAVSSLGQFSQTGQIEYLGANELDINNDRLVVRQLDQLQEFQFDSIASPTIVPLGLALSAPEAIDDVVELSIDYRLPYANVLDNDVFATSTDLAAVKITKLNDAPDGVSVNGQGQLRFSAPLLESEGNYQFSYTVQQSHYETTANVSLNLLHFSDSEIASLRDALLNFAADELETNRSAFSVGRVIHYTETRMPDELQNGTPNPLGSSYGIITEIGFDGSIYRFAANFDGEMAVLDRQDFETLMSLSIQLVDIHGAPVSSIQPGDEFFIQINSRDERPFGQGVFAVAFDLPLPAAKLELTGQNEFLGEWIPIPNNIILDSIDDFVAVDPSVSPPGNSLQSIVRLGVRAIAGGDVTLKMNPAENQNAELLLHGLDQQLSSLNVDFQPLSFTIDGIRPTDTDRNGAVTPTDALRVINFLAIYGNINVDQLSNLATDDTEGESSIRIQTMRRLDTNADGVISPRDALEVINELARAFSSQAEGEEAKRLSDTIANKAADRVFESLSESTSLF